MTDNPTDQERIATAYHEAGHAVMGCLAGRTLEFVTIVPDGTGAVGRTQFTDDVPDGAKRYFDQSEKKQRYGKARVLCEVAGTIAHDLQEPGRAHDKSD